MTKKDIHEKQSQYELLKNHYKEMLEHFGLDENATYEDLKNKYRSYSNRDHADKGAKSEGDQTKNNAYKSAFFQNKEQFEGFKEAYQEFVKEDIKTEFGHQRNRYESELEEILKMKQQQHGQEQIDKKQAVFEFMTDLFKGRNYFGQFQEVELSNGKKVSQRISYGLDNLYTALMETESVEPEEIINMTNMALPHTYSMGSLEEVTAEITFLNRTYEIARKDKPSEESTVLKEKNKRIYNGLVRYEMGIGEKNKAKSKYLLEELSKVDETIRGNKDARDTLGDEFIGEVAESMYQQLKSDYLAYKEMGSEEGAQGTLNNLKIPGFFTGMNYKQRLQLELGNNTTDDETAPQYRTTPQTNRIFELGQ